MQLNTAKKVLRSEQREAKRSVRAGTIAAIHVTWKKLRPDLSGDVEESREQRLAYMTSVLNLRRHLESSRDLTDKQLGRVLDAMRKLEGQPELPGSHEIHAVGKPATSNEQGAEADIHHLATEAQGEAIDKLFTELGWRTEAIEKFVFQRFQRKRHRLLTPKQANSLTMILLNIAASRRIKERGQIERVSRAMIRAEIPALKRRLGIDQKPTPGNREEESYEQHQ